jgi:hypothetical protein
MAGEELSKMERGKCAHRQLAVLLAEVTDGLEVHPEGRLAVLLRPQEEGCEDGPDGVSVLLAREVVLLQDCEVLLDGAPVVRPFREIIRAVGEFVGAPVESEEIDVPGWVEPDFRFGPRFAMMRTP